MTDRPVLPHPRGGFTFRSLPNEQQEAADAAMRSLSSPQFKEAMASDFDQQIEKVSAGSKGPKSQAKLESLRTAKEQIASMPETGMEASVDRIHETAMAPVKAVQEHAAKTGELLPVHAGGFYPERRRIGEKIADEVFGAGTDESLRHQLASPEFSARMSPMQEVRGAAGMAHVLNAADSIKVGIKRGAADMINEAVKGGSGGSEPLKPGNYKFDDLAQEHPNAAALLLGHHVKAKGIVTASATGNDYKDSGAQERAQQRRVTLSENSSLILPPGLETAAGAMVRGYGIVGFPKGARAMSRYYGEAGDWGGSDFHKIPTYKWNIHNADDEVAAATHHFLGALAHGDKWFDHNPEGIDILKRANNSPRWNDPSSTQDVWSAKAASGLPYEIARSLGERTNPEEIMRTANYAQLGVKRPRGSRYGSPGDIGYLFGEEAHRQAASRISVNVPGVGKMTPPPHVVQSMSWFGVQGEENREAVASGARTMAPRSGSDPKSLNPMQFKGF